jgi:hypothetical protein
MAIFLFLIDEVVVMNWGSKKKVLYFIVMVFFSKKTDNLKHTSAIFIFIHREESTVSSFWTYMPWTYIPLLPSSKDLVPQKHGGEKTTTQPIRFLDSSNCAQISSE